MLTEAERATIQEWNDFVARIPPSLTEMRSGLDAFLERFNHDMPEVGAIHEGVELREGLRADVLVPKGPGPHPVMIYVHGGAWIACSPRTHRKLAGQFAAAGYLTINLDYRLAPENPFPAGFDDCVFAAKWTAANAHRWNGDTTRIAMGGDSAGGNLTAAALAALATDPEAPRFSAGVLIYGVFDFPALLERSSNKPMTEGFVRAYVGGHYPEALVDPRVSPLRAVKPGALPPCFIICGTADELVPDSLAMGHALGQAGIPYELHILADMPHGFMQSSQLSGCEKGLRLMFDFLRPQV
jgi:acetyl esterase